MKKTIFTFYIIISMILVATISQAQVRVKNSRSGKNKVFVKSKRNQNKRIVTKRIP